jgi:hypothetical protein
MKSLLFVFLLQGFILAGLFASPTGAFQVTTGAGLGGYGLTHAQRTRQHQEDGATAIKCFKLYTSTASSRRPPTTALFAAGKKKKPSTVEEPPPKVDGLRMLLAYATPWRNPNSIFVYMIVILIILGNYSEAKSVAGGAL